ncbi:Hypothetical predicted protein [Paramuricea clavata]|uniref:Uncharacterized protein n=1 Tax=Paramuricea clavata TaxID=317549 RepID=A0A6S7IJH5_PARCT|nr:Hypothetical predicted protein [Paramuricea clavata]
MSLILSDLDLTINMMTRSASSLQIDNKLLQTLIHSANLLGEADKDIYHCYCVGRIFSGERGRPKYNISREQLELYLHYGFSLGKISEMLFVSTKTARRRIEEFNIKSMAFSDLSNEDLDTVVSEIMRISKLWLQAYVGLSAGQRSSNSTGESTRSTT